MRARCSMQMEVNHSDSPFTTHSIPATPLAGISTTIPSHLAKTPGTPISPEAQNFGAHLTSQGRHQLGDSPVSGVLQSSLSRLSSHEQFVNFEAGYDDPLHVSFHPFIPFLG